MKSAKPLKIQHYCIKCTAIADNRKKMKHKQKIKLIFRLHRAENQPENTDNS